jgi:hypothetical protein
MSQTEITLVQWISLFSSFVAGGFVQSEGNISFVRAAEISDPGNPFFKWVPSEISSFALCAAGLFSFSSAFFFLYVYTLSILYHATGSFTSVAVLYGTETAVLLCYKAWQRELMGYMLLPKATSLAIIGNFVANTVCVGMTSTAPLISASYPGQLGPHVFAGIIGWRLVSSAPIIFFSAKAVAEKEGYWLSLPAALGAYSVAMLIAVGGLLVFFKNMDPSFEKWRFWRPQTGRQMAAERMLDTKMWRKPDDEIKNKDDESWDWVSGLAPFMQPMDTICDWSERLADKYENAATRPEWLTADTFAPRIRYLCKVEGTAAETARLEAVLARLFTELPPPSPSAAARSKVAPSPSPVT